MRTGTENQVSLYLIRHGATAANSRHAYLGITDEPLSDEGRKKLYQNQMAGFYPQDVRVFCGPMLRCRQTAELLYPRQDPVIIAPWTEIDFGRFEGKNYHQLKDDPDYQRWIDSGGREPFPDGESREAFIARTMEGFRAMTLYLRETPGPAAAIVHGGTIMALVSALTGGDYFDYQVKNAGGYLLELTIHSQQARLENLLPLQEQR